MRAGPTPSYASEDLRHTMDGAARHKRSGGRGDVDAHATPLVKTLGAIVVDRNVQYEPARPGGGSSVFGVVEKEGPDPGPSIRPIDSHSLEIPISLRDSVHEVEQPPGEEPRGKHPDGPGTGCTE